MSTRSPDPDEAEDVAAPDQFVLWVQAEGREPARIELPRHKLEDYPKRVGVEDVDRELRAALGLR